MSEKYPNAALRHLEDSRRLLENERWDNSAYLAGYVIECSLKAAITTPQAPAGIDVVKIGHDLQALAGQLEIMAASRNPGRRRTVSSLKLFDLKRLLSSGFPWKETLRYESSGYIRAEEARKFHNTAERVFSGLARDLCEGA